MVGIVLALHRFVHTSLEYTPGATYIGVDVNEVLAQAKGVCQDYAHLAVALCRSVGIPARYVSGYFFASSDATGADVDGDQVQVQTHAWFEAAIPDWGWLALDPTNAQQVGQRHIAIGHGRDYDDVPPVRGVYSGGGRPSTDAVVEIRRHAPRRPPGAGPAAAVTSAPLFGALGFAHPGVVVLLRLAAAQRAAPARARSAWRSCASLDPGCAAARRSSRTT